MYIYINMYMYIYIYTRTRTVDGGGGGSYSGGGSSDVLDPVCVYTCTSVEINTWTIDFEESQYWCG